MSKYSGFKRWYRALVESGEKGLEPVRRTLEPNLDHLTFREPLGLYTGQLEDLPKLIQPGYPSYTRGKEAARGVTEFSPAGISEGIARVDLHPDAKVLDFSKPEDWYKELKAFSDSELSPSEAYILKEGVVDVFGREGTEARKNIQTSLTNWFKKKADAVIVPDVAANQPDVSQLILLNPGKATGTVRDKEKGKLVSKLLTGAGVVGTGTALAPEESEAAMSLKTPIKLAKEAQKTLSKDWDISSTAKYLIGKVWNGREIQAVYKPKFSKPSPFKPGHPDYKPSIRSDKRAVVFSDGSYNMLDKDDLHTVVSAIGSDEYMGKITPQMQEKALHQKGIQSLRMKNWMNIGHDTLEEAEKTRKKYARDWIDLFGGQGIGIETIEYLGKYRNISSPYIDVLRESVPKIISNLEESVKEYKKALKPVPKAILEKLDELKSIKFLKNQSTYISKYGFKGRDWSTPEGWEGI